MRCKSMGIKYTIYELAFLKKFRHKFIDGGHGERVVLSVKLYVQYLLTNGD
jgi:hypothetical protein